MPITTMTEIWARLDAYTLTPEGAERAVNHLNEWGGFSRKLQMPVFTGWRDLTRFDKKTKSTTALVLDATWTNAVGVNNQERWLAHAEMHNNSVGAFFVIHAVDPSDNPRKIERIDDERVFIGKILRMGGMAYISGQPRPL